MQSIQKYKLKVNCGTIPFQFHTNAIVGLICDCVFNSWTVIYFTWEPYSAYSAMEKKVIKNRETKSRTMRKFTIHCNKIWKFYTTIYDCRMSFTWCFEYANRLCIVKFVYFFSSTVHDTHKWDKWLII